MSYKGQGKYHVVCYRCGHEWDTDIPPYDIIRCGKCRSPYWRSKTRTQQRLEIEAAQQVALTQEELKKKEIEVQEAAKKKAYEELRAKRKAEYEAQLRGHTWQT